MVNKFTQIKISLLKNRAVETYEIDSKWFYYLFYEFNKKEVNKILPITDRNYVIIAFLYENIIEDDFLLEFTDYFLINNESNHELIFNYLNKKLKKPKIFLI